MSTYEPPAAKNYENAVTGASRDIPNMLSYQTRAGMLSNVIKDSFTLQKEAGLTPNLDKLKQQLAQIKVLESEMYEGLSDNKNAKKALTQNMKLYLIDGSFGVQEIVPNSYFAAGTGAPVAIGAMASLIAYCDCSNPKEMVKIAVEACIEHAQGCGGSAQVFSYC